MHWTKWPYWLRGGVIGFGIALVSYLLMQSCSYVLPVITNPQPESWSGLLCVPPGLPILVFASVYQSLLFHLNETILFNLSWNISIILGLISWFILGALIGAAISMIKRWLLART